MRPAGDDARLRARPLPGDLPPPSAARVLMRRCWMRLLRARIPSFIGAAGSMALVAGAIGYGVVVGGHAGDVVAFVEDARDQAANSVGFGIVDLRVSGHNQLTREEVLAAAQVTGRSSLLFLDVDAARERLKRNPWIGEAIVRKLLPGELQIEIREREPFALWQKDRHVSVIADDGTVLEGFVAPQLLSLPLVVGAGAETRAKEFLTQLDRHPGIRDQVRAAILVGERRWNLRLQSGLDIRLPESDPAAALDRLASLDREVRLLGRDITVVDMRLSDRVTVRLSERAAQARQELREQAKKKGGRG